MIEVSVLQVVALCIAVFGLGFQICMLLSMAITELKKSIWKKGKGGE